LKNNELNQLKLVELREVAKQMGVKSIPKYSKSQLLDLVLGLESQKLIQEFEPISAEVKV
jgi:hypothetical protein